MDDGWKINVSGFRRQMILTVSNHRHAVFQNADAGDFNAHHVRLGCYLDLGLREAAGDGRKKQRVGKSLMDAP